MITSVCAAAELAVQTARPMAKRRCMASTPSGRVSSETHVACFGQVHLDQCVHQTDALLPQSDLVFDRGGIARPGCSRKLRVEFGDPVLELDHHDRGVSIDHTL